MIDKQGVAAPMCSRLSGCSFGASCTCLLYTVYITVLTMYTMKIVETIADCDRNCIVRGRIHTCTVSI